MNKRGRVVRTKLLFAVLGSAILGAIALAAIATDQGFAYNDDGHFYTAVSVENSRLPAFKDKIRDAAVLMGLCAELPDLSKEYDAVSLRGRLLASVQGSLWGGFSSCWGEDVCHMVTVHHYLHGLTDGDAEAVTAAAIATLQALVPHGGGVAELEPNHVCAAGFAIHLLGDSFAHRRLREPTRMYPPGLGHFRDDHNPDFILYNETRTNNYLRYAHALDTALESTDNPLWPMLTDFLKEARVGAALKNRYNEKTLRDRFKATLKTETIIWAPDPSVEYLAKTGGIVLTRTCKDVLSMYKLNGIDQVNCNKVWQTYKNAAIPEFERRKIPAVCPRDDRWSDGVSK